ncbi:receptor-type tyrosine-protein phosphatase C [Planoprotostelium fungivorum]|uniref:protein-tyrosine-phosphatase n=1 Tax=Planoprotostelium fungivorum TaxID=1890364 RepID=A0A2P6NXR6_9EUKA|nr:receptor-type tyrosine-protein phosphatase C [Planoprotostelium fungivorum]PRP88739.1 receptor-type tyrosine-protein phosphatase C [Planoprotostelium fungivorum]
MTTSRTAAIDCLISAEFDEIQKLSAEEISCSTAAQKCNSNKNRYFDILPTDQSRVRLRCSQDYINASHITGETPDCSTYIACQAPLSTTIDDFWRMIWEQACGVIVMLTSLREKNVEKCAQYWPEVNKGAIYGRLLVHHKGVSQHGPFTIRSLVIQHMDQMQVQRNISHVEFSAWPDKGAADPTILIELIRLVRQLRQARSNEANGPVVTHCSAGVGRTGAFLACDITLSKLQSGMPIDIRRTVLALRKQRSKMVMTVEQYALIHSVAREALGYFGRENGCGMESNCGTVGVAQSGTSVATI